MNFVYLNLTNQQRHWAKQAIGHITVSLAEPVFTVALAVVDEPPCPGHNDYMCTTFSDPATGVGATINIRAGADDPNAIFNSHLKGTEQVRKFFQESIVHEIGHVISLTRLELPSEREAVAEMFWRRGATGEPTTQGSNTDWNPLDKPWEDRIQEAVAEVFKDTFLPADKRVFDNRTHWFLPKDRFPDFIAAVTSQFGGADERDSFIINNLGPEGAFTPHEAWVGVVVGAASDAEVFPALAGGSDAIPHIVPFLNGDNPAWEFEDWSNNAANFDHRGFIASIGSYPLGAGPSGADFYMDGPPGGRHFHPQPGAEIPPTYCEGYTVFPQLPTDPFDPVTGVIPASSRDWVNRNDIHLYLEGFTLSDMVFAHVTTHWLDGNFGVPDWGSFGTQEAAAQAESQWRCAVDYFDAGSHRIAEQEYHVEFGGTAPGPNDDLPPVGVAPQLYQLPNGSYGVELDWVALAGGWVRLRSIWQGTSGLGSAFAGLHGNAPPFGPHLRWAWTWPAINPHPPYPYPDPTIEGAQLAHAVQRLRTAQARAALRR